MSQKTKSCQNCKASFTIEPEDFLFYEKIQVPEPTFCPECRLQRRMAWRKESPIFYNRQCEATGEKLISVYNPNGPIKVYDQTGKNKSQTAKLLGIGLNTLRRKLESYGIN